MFLFYLCIFVALLGSRPMHFIGPILGPKPRPFRRFEVHKGNKFAARPIRPNDGPKQTKPKQHQASFSVTDHQAQVSFSFWPAKLTRMLLFLATAACKTAKPLQLCTPIQLVSMKPPVRSFQPPYERLSSAGLPFPYASGSPTLVQLTWQPPQA